MTSSNDDVSVSGFSDDEFGILEDLKSLALGEATPAAKEEPTADQKKEFDDKELLYIYDSLITTNTYVESSSISKTVKVAWRSRTLKEANAIARLIDSAGFNTILSVQNHTNTMNMATSLVMFNGRDFSKASLADKKSFVECLPEIIIVKLSESLRKFDYKLSQATEVGEANF